MGYCNVNGKTYKVSQQVCNAGGGTYSDVPAHPLEDVPGQQGVSGSTGNRAIANMLGINNSTSYLDAIESGLSKLGRGVGDVLSGNVELPGIKAERIKASRQSNVPDNLNPNSPNFGKFTIPPAGPQTGPTNEAGLFQQSDVATGKQAPAQPAGSMSIWDEMKTKDYWQKSMSGMPGDTRISRIGQLMSYYGTPQAQRGVDPAGGFASRDYEAAQLIQKQLAAKQAQTQEPVDIFSNIGNATMVNAVKQKVAKAMGKGDWLSLDPKDEDVVATANEVVIEIRSKMQKINPDTGTYYTFAEAEKITLRAVE